MGWFGKKKSFDELMKEYDNVDLKKFSEAILALLASTYDKVPLSDHKKFLVNSVDKFYASRLSCLQQAAKIAKGSEELIVNAKFLDLKEWFSTTEQILKGKL